MYSTTLASTRDLLYFSVKLYMIHKIKNKHRKRDKDVGNKR